MTASLAQYLGLAILPGYLVASVAIGWTARRKFSAANDFLNASRSLPLWVVAPAFFSVNCGALELVGLSAAAAQYGVQAFHFYWIGAIPGMIFMSGVMIPLYMRSGVNSLPEYLEKRFDVRVRLINAWLLLLTGTALSGIGLYALAQVLNAVFHWSFLSSVAFGAGIVLINVEWGGLRATIFNEVFRVALIVLGLLPLVCLRTTSFHPGPYLHDANRHLWTALPGISPGSPLDKLGVVCGLGMVLSFSYWCTDFVLVQRALTARSVKTGQLAPLLAGFAKLAFSFLVICPALGAVEYLGQGMPRSFDQTLPSLMVASYGPSLIGLGLTVLLASLMSALGANVSAFSALWTEEIYRRCIQPHATERHYLLIGRASVAAAVALSIATSYITFLFHDLMEYNQLLFSLFSAPFFAVFLLGLFGTRTTARGALAGIGCGVSAASAHLGFVIVGGIRYGSLMSANFYTAMIAFVASLAAASVFSLPSEKKPEKQLGPLVFRWKAIGAEVSPSKVWWLLAVALAGACALLNFWWR